MTEQQDPEHSEIKQLNRFADFSASQRVLEIGCGDGRLTWRYARSVGHIVGIEIVRDDLRLALVDMTGVSDKQIRELGIEITPQHPETELRKAGARYESRKAFRDIFATHVVVDDEKRFVTGQNQNSGRETAHAMMAIAAGSK